jgi:GTP-dependent dephospho-CoA kinase
MRPGATPSASSDERVWVVPESLRSRLAQTYGPVLSGTAADEKIRSLTTFATCGDYVTGEALRLDHPPLVGIVDYTTRRNEPIEKHRFGTLAARRLVKVRNPAGMLTERLRTAIAQLIHDGGGLIEVDGEEDLASLALVESMPAGATVIYGIPGAGASFVAVDAAAKERVNALIAEMEERWVNLGRQDP